MKIYTMEQRTPEWMAIRAGKVTGSCAESIIKERKRGTGELKERADLRKRLVCERLTGQPLDKLPYKPSAMQHGVETEDAAFARYEWETGLLVDRVGFVAHDELDAGCSPDGVVNNFDGLIELKCPEPITHYDYLTAGVIPWEYKPQLIHSLWITGAQWIDFVSFDDRMRDKGLQFFRRRLLVSEVDLTAYELMVRAFLGEVERELNAVRGLIAVGAA